MNNIENGKILEFAKDYAELCRKHGLYLVFNDDFWLQEVGDEQDLADIEPSLIESLVAQTEIKLADQWTQEERLRFTEKDSQQIKINRINAVV